MLDEAQTIRSSNFELIRSLLNFETDTRKLLNIILLGQTELARKLDARPELKSRVTIFGALSSLSRDDTENMIRFRWQIAGNSPVPFTPGAIDELFRQAKGVPRLLCTLCDNVLATACVRELKIIEPPLVISAAKDLRFDAESGAPE